MRENLPVFPHRRAGFADAPALFPAVGIIEIALLATFGGGIEGFGTAGMDPASPPRQRSGEVEAVNFAQGLQVMAE